MGNIVFSQAAKFLQKRRNTRRWIAVVLCLALVVTSGTFGVLTRHGSALTGADRVLACVYENHVHGDECCDEAGELVCGYADYCVHVHQEGCYDGEGSLVCPLPETETHVHDDSCYGTEQVPVCGMEQNAGHQHTDECYEIELLDMVCEKEEHVHDENCYELIPEGEEVPEAEKGTESETPAESTDTVQDDGPAGNADASGSETSAENADTSRNEAPAESADESDGSAEGSEATQREDSAESTEETDNNISVESTEGTGNSESADNAGQNRASAEGTDEAQDEDTAQSEAPAGNAEETQSEAPAENPEPAEDDGINECTENRRMVCEKEEHIHANECYNQNRTLKCEKEETDNVHIHTEACYEARQIATCGKLEMHTHAEACYTDGILACGKQELTEHVHGDECFQAAPVTELTATAGDVTITVSAAEEGIIPAGAELSVTPVVKAEAEALDSLENEEERAEAEALNAVYDEILQGLEASVEDDETREIKHFLAYDISFHTQNENGETEEVELNGDVNVTLEFPQGALPEEIISDENTQIESVDVLDMKETGEGRTAEVQDAVVDTTQDADVEKVETRLSDSSTLAIAWFGEMNQETGEYVYEDDDVVIRVVPMAEGILPENAKLKVIPVIASEETGEQYQQVAEKLMEKAENEEYAIAGFLAYDISFVDGEGNKIEPKGEVKVTMNYKEAKIPAEVGAAAYAIDGEDVSGGDAQAEGSAAEAELNVTVMHLEEDEAGSVNVVDMAEQNKVTALETTEEQKIQNAEFVTGGFSIFTITWTWDTSKPYIYEDEQVKITVTAVDRDAIPEGTTLSITPIRAEDAETAEQYQEVARRLMEKAADERYAVAGFLAYDISLIGKDGVEIEPGGKVKVTMEYKQPMAMVQIDATVYALVSQELGLPEADAAAGTEVPPAEGIQTEASSAEDMAVGTEVPPAEDTSAIDENTVNDTEQAADNAEMGGEDGTASEEEQIEVTIMHLEEDGQGEVEQIVDMTETDQIQAIEKTEQQEVCKVEFVTESFSMFVLSWNDKGIQFKPGTGEKMDVPSIMDQVILPEGKNGWQIVDERYEGNGSANKEPLKSDPVLNDIRYQKNVIPTDVENEFLVYLSIDVKSVFESYFSMAAYQATTSNSDHSYKVGDIVPSMEGNMSVKVTTTPQEKGFSALFTILDSNGNVVADKMRIYWSQGNNVTFFLKTAQGNYVLMGISVNKGTTNTIRLTKEAEDAIRQDITTKVMLGTVTDTMGPYIEFQGIVAGDYLADNHPSCVNGVLTWTPAPKEKAAVEKTTEKVDGKTKETTWSLNVAELLYKVRLKVEAPEFHSCADNMDSTVTEPESYEVNQSAVLTSDKGTVTFQKPYVRGLLYDFTLLKRAQDENGNDLGVLPGAGFEVKDAEGKSLGTAESDEKGIVRFTGLPWGSYTVTEIQAPEGYEEINESIGALALCYTEDKQLPEEERWLDQNPDNPVDMIHTDYTKAAGEKFEIGDETGADEQPANVIYNTKMNTSVKVIKEWVDGNNELDTRPAEITFTLKFRAKDSTDDTAWADFTDENHQTAVYTISEETNWQLTIDNLPAGNEYKVVETPVPGYTTIVEPVLEQTAGTGDGESASSGPTEFTIRNVLQTQIVKRSSSSPDLMLQGAVFTLTGTNVNWVGTSGADGRMEWKDGEETVSLEMLPDGGYSLSETDAPAGYGRSDAVWTITVKDGLICTVTATDMGEVTGVNVGNKQAFYFENSPVYALPSTGGEGIYWYSIGGMLMMCAAVLILYRIKNKKVRGCRRA